MYQTTTYIVRILDLNGMKSIAETEEVFWLEINNHLLKSFN